MGTETGTDLTRAQYSNARVTAFSFDRRRLPNESAPTRRFAENSIVPIHCGRGLERFRIDWQLVKASSKVQGACPRGRCQGLLSCASLSILAGPAGGPSLPKTLRSPYSCAAALVLFCKWSTDTHEDCGERHRTFGPKNAEWVSKGGRNNGTPRASHAVQRLTLCIKLMLFFCAGVEPKTADQPIDL